MANVANFKVLHLQHTYWSSVKVMQAVNNDLFLHNNTKKRIKILQIHIPEMFLSYSVLGLKTVHFKMSSNKTCDFWSLSLTHSVTNTHTYTHTHTHSHTSIHAHRISWTEWGVRQSMLYFFITGKTACTFNAICPSRQTSKYDDWVTERSKTTWRFITDIIHPLH